MCFKCKRKSNPVEMRHFHCNECYFEMWQSHALKQDETNPSTKKYRKKHASECQSCGKTRVLEPSSKTCTKCAQYKTVTIDKCQRCCRINVAKFCTDAFCVYCMKLTYCQRCKLRKRIAKDQLNCDYCRLFAIPVSLLSFEYLFEPIKEEITMDDKSTETESPVSKPDVSEEDDVVNRFLV